MPTRRMEAFSDAVIAILITVMVLGLRVPHGTTWSAVADSGPVLLSYVLSFVYLGIYWNNHHHMLMLTERVNGLVLWANLHLLFWLSLIPFTTGWLGENRFAATPAAAYGIVLLAAAVAYFGLRTAIIREQGASSKLAKAFGRDLKGKASPLFYLLGIVLAAVNRWLSLAVYVAVALWWLVPDRRVERAVAGASQP
ncbi:TMEM175 family protein [Rhizomonospora bruguierae]|uniref:TMEM175 family protein n=1 Tax=Rhizomonospora bruguierae TaxID=1581705 RepID=UPI001BCC8E8F|nr:TMEM175 family protein [Micromonospora sp. NBRC 107566]